MSNRILNLVDRARMEDPVTKGILRAIANQSNDAGTGVWSSKAYLAWCTGYHVRTVQAHIRKLNDADLLIVHYRPGTSNLYRIDVEELDAIGEDWTKPIEEPWGEPEPQEERATTSRGESQDLPNHKETPEEPTYIDDVGGVPDELEMEWDNFLRGWKTCFPSKTQPRPTSSLKSKFKTRMKNTEFRKTWRSALWFAKDLTWTHEEGWFKAEWVLKNSDNIAKLLDGTFDFKTTQKKEAAPQKRPAFVDARPKEDK